LGGIFAGGGALEGALPLPDAFEDIPGPVEDPVREPREAGHMEAVGFRRRAFLEFP
jgi:hypothetical protein